jgi:hypothetical protein
MPFLAEMSESTLGVQFVQGEAQLHTATLTFLNLEWLGKTADLYVCDQCGFIHWFLPR